jgi:hypothetical protein
MKSRIIVFVWVSLLLGTVASASRWYVGPNGRPTNPGTKSAPWDIASALDGKEDIEPGDTIYLLAGTYRRRPKELFEIRLVGTADKPIHICPVPGERVRIDGGLAVQSPSAHVRLWNLEIFVSEPRPQKPVSAGSHPSDLHRPHGGLHMFGGENCKYINLIIHDCNQGISCWKGEINPEIYGCIIYNNGWLGTDRGHGHCIYTQNKDGVKTISNCIMTCQYDGTYTVHAYGSERAYVDNFLVEENICYGKGPFLIGGGRPSRNIRVFRNYLYGVSMRIGYTAPHNVNCEVRNNVIVNGDLSIVRYKKAVQQGNLVIRKDQDRPMGAEVFILANRYDLNRAHLVIYNWDNSGEVRISPEPLLERGDSFKLFDPKHTFGEPVLTGAFTRDQIVVPVDGEFAVYVFLKDR